MVCESIVGTSKSDLCMTIDLMHFMGGSLFCVATMQRINPLGGQTKNLHEKCLLELTQLSSAISKYGASSMIFVCFTILFIPLTGFGKLSLTLIFYCRSSPQPASLIPNCMAIRTVQ